MSIIYELIWCQSNEIPFLFLLSRWICAVCVWAPLWQVLGGLLGILPFLQNMKSLKNRVQAAIVYSFSDSCSLVTNEGTYSFSFFCRESKMECSSINRLYCCSASAAFCLDWLASFTAAAFCACSSAIFACSNSVSSPPSSLPLPLLSPSMLAPSPPSGDEVLPSSAPVSAPPATLLPAFFVWPFGFAMYPIASCRAAFSCTSNWCTLYTSWDNRAICVVNSLLKKVNCRHGMCLQLSANCLFLFFWEKKTNNERVFLI